MPKRFAIAGPLAAALLAGGCGDVFIGINTDGRIEVDVRTRGVDPDLDGFSVSVDGGVQQLVGSEGAVTLADLREGTHSVQLSGLSDNCRVDGSNPRPVAVGAGQAVAVAFEVRCARITTGSLEVVVETSGQSPDTDGYAIAVAGGGIRFIGISGTETFTGLAEGAHLVSLKDVHQDCTVVGGSPRPFMVVAGKTMRVELAVACGVVDLDPSS
ncbi:MAG: hypothetical protein M3Q93_10300 [Gemmatimonadota bacterium]|nr:hypothetical protein [Gemmatimonadota bacterium]